MLLVGVGGVSAYFLSGGGDTGGPNLVATTGTAIPTSGIPVPIPPVTGVDAGVGSAIPIAIDIAARDAGTAVEPTNTTTGTTTIAKTETPDQPNAPESQDLEGAVRSLATAQRAVGRSHSIVSGPRTSLARIGGRMVGIMIQQSKCPGAQALYRQLRSVGADSSARGQFVPGLCDRP